MATISRSYQDDGMFLESMARCETLEVDESIILITKAGQKIERVFVPGVLLLQPKKTALESLSES